MALLNPEGALATGPDGAETTATGVETAATVSVEQEFCPHIADSSVLSIRVAV
jgi:hypothetical protein